MGRAWRDHGKSAVLIRRVGSSGKAEITRCAAGEMHHDSFSFLFDASVFSSAVFLDVMGNGVTKTLVRAS